MPATRTFLLIIAAILVVGGGCLIGLNSLYRDVSEPPTWERIERGINKAHPGLPQISTAELAKQIESGIRPILLDCRNAEEFAVSHLVGAVHAETPEDAFAFASNPDAQIVVYCSVGVRSADLVAVLVDAGYTDVHNLAGSIFQWSNENRPLVDGDGASTTEVHPFSVYWGTLLN